MDLVVIAVIGAAVLFWKNRSTTAVPTTGPKPSGIMWMQPPITSPPLMLPPSFGTATCAAIHCGTAVSTVPIVPKPLPKPLNPNLNPANQIQPGVFAPDQTRCTTAKALCRIARIGGNCNPRGGTGIISCNGEFCNAFK